MAKANVRPKRKRNHIFVPQQEFKSITVSTNTKGIPKSETTKHFHLREFLPENMPVKSERKAVYEASKKLCVIAANKYKKEMEAKHSAITNTAVLFELTENFEKSSIRFKLVKKIKEEAQINFEEEATV